MAILLGATRLDAQETAAEQEAATATRATAESPRTTEEKVLLDTYVVSDSVRLRPL